MESAHQDVVEDARIGLDGGPGAFISNVQTAIDAKLELPSGRKCLQIPMVDAPLFGSICPRQALDGSYVHADNVLPPRKQTDALVNFYWRHMEPFEPLLDQERFYHSYQALFSGSDVGCDEHIFISTLHAICAISTQLQESIPPEQRNESSTTFFLRAWSVLRPEVVLWETGSLELVQCLLLIAQYLRCTSKLHQTWMALGSAMRIGQSLGLHVSDYSFATVDRDRVLKQKVWQYSVFMERSLSWTLGRALSIPLVTPLSLISFPQGGRNLTERHDEFSIHLSSIWKELDDLTGQIMLLHALNTSGYATRLGLSQSTQQIDPRVAVQLDERLAKLYTSFSSIQQPADDSSTERSIVFRLRLTHARVLLFRPMLCRFCRGYSPAEGPPAPVDRRLGDHILQDCAMLCVESAKKLITLVCDNYRSSAAIGILPWWYRVFYLYAASQILIAAMLRADVFAPMVSDSWYQAMSAFSAHEYLSPAVTEYSLAFQQLWRNVTDMHRSDSEVHGASGRPSDVPFQGVFQDLSFDIASPALGMEGMGWMDTINWNL